MSIMYKLNRILQYNGTERDGVIHYDIHIMKDYFLIPNDLFFSLRDFPTEYKYVSFPNAIICDATPDTLKRHLKKYTDKYSDFFQDYEVALVCGYFVAYLYQEVDDEY